MDDTVKATFIEQFDECLIQMDDNSAIFEFVPIDDFLILNRPLKILLDALDILFSDYQIKIVKTSGHPTIQVQLRLEEGLWKSK